LKHQVIPMCIGYLVYMIIVLHSTIQKFYVRYRYG